MRVRYSTFWRLRKLAVEIHNTVEEHSKTLRDIKYSLDNHIYHRLDDQKDKITKMNANITQRLNDHDSKFNQILDRLPVKNT